jgi:tetratricopeptide (TPR) repeat protein/NAD-dependent SIR2 family protein deacetylase
MNYHRSVNEIAETLRNARNAGRGCTLLIGAGCSVKAGIPLASGFVDIIKQRHPLCYKRAENKTYPQCMAELLLDERRHLIAEYVDKAKINWAHVGIARLMQEGYVDRVLTTNFDPLVVRACALLGEFPAVYDFAASQLLKSAMIPQKAVFYLHGQRTGFILMNTEQDFKDHSKRLGGIFEDAGRGRVWIIVGYSGENDPVFDHLARVNQFDNGLYWVGFEDSEPPKHVREKLLEAKKDAFFCKGHDADSFFVSLTQELHIFPPDLVGRPFSHLDRTLEMLTPYTAPGQTSEEDVTRTTRQWIQDAINQFEAKAAAIVRSEKAEATRGKEDSPPTALAIQQLIMAGDYDRVVAFHKDYNNNPTPELADAISLAYLMQGVAFYQQAKVKKGDEADRLFDLAIEKYQAALAIKPDYHYALNNWGIALRNQAKNKQGDEADRLFNLAVEKYKAALAIKPDFYEALNNWGNALSEQAKNKQGDEASRLFDLAIEKYKAAIVIKPDSYEALNNWGNALSEQAKNKQGDEASRLFDLAIEKYQAALAIKPDYHYALNGWGIALSDQAKNKQGDEASRLFDLAIEKYKAALAIKPDYHYALNGWGIALSEQAKNKQGDEADRLFDLAVEKYKAALAIKPDYHYALNGWGIALRNQAENKQGDEASRLFELAVEKYKAALAIKPDFYEALNGWGIALSDQAKNKQGNEAGKLFAQASEKFLQVESMAPGHSAYNLACLNALMGNETGCREWLEKSSKHGKLPTIQHILADSDLDSVRELDWFKKLISEA